MLLSDPFQGVGAWRNTMELQKPDNSPRPGPEIAKKQRVAQERAAHRVRSWIAQNQMRGVLGQCPQALHEGFSILLFLKRQSLLEGYFRCSVNDKKHSVRDEGAQVP